MHRCGHRQRQNVVGFAHGYGPIAAPHVHQCSSCAQVGDLHVQVVGGAVGQSFVEDACGVVEESRGDQMVGQVRICPRCVILGTEFQ